MHVRDQPVVSLETVFVSQFCVMVTPIGSHANATITLVVYQHVAQPPPLHVTLTGNALAAGAKTSSGAHTRARARRYRAPRLIGRLGPRAAAARALLLQAAQTRIPRARGNAAGRCRLPWLRTTRPTRRRGLRTG